MTGEALSSGNRAPMLDILLADINGIWRGLQTPGTPKKIVAEKIRWPRSLYAMRFDGGVTEETGLGLKSGDPDYPCEFLPDTLASAPWREGRFQAVAVMQTPEGKPFFADPRTQLMIVTDQLRADGLNPVMAAELEFYLEDAGSAGPADAGRPSDLYSMDALAAHEDFLSLLRATATAQGIEAGSAISEYAPGQFEVNLAHKEPLRACLEALLLRRAVRECARATGRRATFMAKPAAGISGSGLHMHLSFADGRGGFAFADERMLMAAVAGTLALSAEAAALYSPFGNSFRRHEPGSYAPLSACWGREHRGAYVRIPAAAVPAQMRLELRAPGADANPYLAAAALLAGAHWGISNDMRPPKPMAGGGALPETWPAALAALRRARILPRYLDKEFLRIYRQIKESEMRRETAHLLRCDPSFYGGII